MTPAPRVTLERRLPPISDEIVDRLRLGGASKDLVEFADRHVTRYSQADLERAQTRAMLWTLIVVAVGVLLVLWLAS